MCDDNAAGVLRIDGDKINRLVAIASGLLLAVRERGLVVEPTIFGRKFPIVIRLGPEPNEGAA